MRTLNISVTDEQYNLIDQLIMTGGFANRSEFFRTMLRNFNSFDTPPTSEASQVLAAFTKSGKYNKRFLSSLKKGLQESIYFK